MSTIRLYWWRLLRWLHLKPPMKVYDAKSVTIYIDGVEITEFYDCSFDTWPPKSKGEL